MGTAWSDVSLGARVVRLIAALIFFGMSVSWLLVVVNPTYNAIYRAVLFTVLAGILLASGFAYGKLTPE